MIFTYPLFFPSLHATFTFKENLNKGIEVNLELPKDGDGFLLNELIYEHVIIFQANLNNLWPQKKVNKIFSNLTIETTLNDAYTSVMNDIHTINNILKSRNNKFTREVVKLYYSHNNAVRRIL